MILTFNIAHKGKLCGNALELADYDGPIPQSGSLVSFSGSEREILELAKLPHGIWRISQVAYELESGATTRVTITLELRSEKRKRDTAARADASDPTI
jgi:hypothetical protein